jgi:hypothetical protein
MPPRTAPERRGKVAGKYESSIPSQLLSDSGWWVGTGKTHRGAQNPLDSGTARFASLLRLLLLDHSTIQNGPVGSVAE